MVFIIRKDIEKEFKEVIGDRIASICSSHNVTVDYAFQDINDIPGTLPEGRTKPWGTGQAVLAAKKVIKTPFIVINADDYYGKEGFKDVSKQLHANPKAELCAFKGGEWIRVAGELVEDDRVEARQSMLDAYPSLKKMYAVDDGNTEVFYFKNGVATISSFTHEPKVIKF